MPTVRARLVSLAASVVLLAGLGVGGAAQVEAAPMPIPCTPSEAHVFSSEELVSSDFALRAVTGSVALDGALTPVSVNNEKPALGELVLYNRLWGSDLIKSPGSPRLGVVVINGVVTQISDAALGVPLNGVVLVGTGDSIESLEKLRVGDKVVVELLIDPVRH